MFKEYEFEMFLCVDDDDTDVEVTIQYIFEDMGEGYELCDWCIRACSIYDPVLLEKRLTESQIEFIEQEIFDHYDYCT